MRRVTFLTETERHRNQRERGEAAHRDVRGPPVEALNQGIKQRGCDDADDAGAAQRERHRESALLPEPSGYGTRPDQRRGRATDDREREERQVERADARAHLGHPEHRDRKRGERTHRQRPRPDAVGKPANERRGQHEACRGNSLCGAELLTAPAEGLGQRADQDAQRVDRHARHTGGRADRRGEDDGTARTELALITDRQPCGSSAHRKAPYPFMRLTSGQNRPIVAWLLERVV